MNHYLYTRTGNLIGDITQHISRYQHELTDLGPYRASFRIETSEAADIDQLRAWYETMLMNQFVSFDGTSELWRGYIYDVSFEARGLLRQRSMDTVINRVKVSMSDLFDRTITRYTAWHNHEESQDLYGIHEDIKHLNGDGSFAYGSDGTVLRDTVTGLPQFEHDWYATHVLNSYAYPLAEYSGDSAAYEQANRDVGVLNIVCVGRSKLANGVKLSDGYLADSGEPDGTNLRDSGLEAFANYEHGDELTISQEIRRIVGVINTNGGWLWELNIEQTNDTLTAAGVSSVQGAVDRLRELVNIPDQNGNRYEFYVHKNGGVEYRKVSNTWSSFLHPNGEWVQGNGDPVGWYADVQPIKIIDPRTSMMSGDIVIRPKRVAVVNGEARFSESLERTEVDMQASIRANRMWLLDATKGKKK